MDSETKKLFKKMKDNNGWIPVSDLVERFVEVDEYFQHSSWNLYQILNNINMIIPLEIPDECIELLTGPMYKDSEE